MALLHIGKLPVGRVPRIVGTVISAASVERAARLKTRAFDLVEIRADRIAGEWRAAGRRLRASGVPLLLTIRSAREGGAWRGRETERKKSYLSALDLADAVDVEIRSRLLKPLARAARRRGRMVIGSFHDFGGTPSQAVLRTMIARGRAAGAHIVKIAVRLKGPDDLARLCELLNESRRPLCVVGMGPRAAAARIALARAGSCLTYGYVDRPVAPGQPSCRELAKRWNRGKFTA